MSKVNAKYIHYDTNTLDKDSNNALKVKDNVYEPVFSKNTAFNKNFGTSAGTVSEGNHIHTIAHITGLQSTLDSKEPVITTLNVARGGTGITTLPIGRIPYGNEQNAFKHNSDFKYDETNKRLLLLNNNTIRLIKTTTEEGDDFLNIIANSATGNNDAYINIKSYSVGGTSRAGVKLTNNVAKYPGTWTIEKNDTGDLYINHSTIKPFIRIPQVYNKTSNAGTSVNVLNDGSLVRKSSSLKYKKDIVSMSDVESERIYKLRSVKYKSKCDGDDPNEDHYGFIGEEVELIDDVYVRYSKNYKGEYIVESLSYEEFIPAIVKELQKLRNEVQNLKLRNRPLV